MDNVLLAALIVKLPNGQYQITVNEVVHVFDKLYDAFWTLKEAAEQQTRKLREQDR